ncbi:MAG: excinuclease ABC subunit UvrC, partial [Clostridia bacterium]|nr:excinuclease ABC subunit UvrC [Clostridia bacterium]
LIKEYSPRYNIKLKDAKSYPYIKISAGEFPKVEVTRTRKSDGAAYFGPYRSAAMAYEALEVVCGIFALPTCKYRFPKDTGKIRPCLYRQMGRCCAPCVPDITKEAYRDLISSAKRVFEGKTKEAEGELTRRMYDAADKERFELAAHYRNSITALKQLSEKQKVVSDGKDERDVFALWEGEGAGVLAVLQIREGKLLYKNEYTFDRAALTETEDLSALLTEYYNEATPPKEILLDRAIEEDALSLLSDFLSQKAGRRVHIKCPQRGPLKQLCDLAKDNARQKAETVREKDDKAERTLARLAALLGMESLPERIEAYDISNFGDEAITCGMVVYENGAPKKSDYRTFKIRTTGGADDYGAMKEAISRRLAHIGDGTASLSEKPDLILLDGGVGHVCTIRPILEASYPEIALFGMVKDEYHKTRCLTDGEYEISIANEKAVFPFIYGIQEEVHRTAIRAMKKRKTKSLKKSTMEQIQGNGDAKARILLKRFGSISAIKESDEETLSA